MAQLNSILSLDRRDIESLWMMMYGGLNFGYPRPSSTSTYLGLLDGATAGEYLAIQEGVASLGGELVIPPRHLQSGLLEVDDLGVIGGLIVADPRLEPPAHARSVCLNSREGKPLEVIAHLYPLFIERGRIDGVRVACDDSTARTWLAATGDLPISVVHTGMAEIDPAFRAALEAEGQAGTYRHVLRTEIRADLDARKPPRHAHLAAAITAALEFIS